MKTLIDRFGYLLVGFIIAAVLYEFYLLPKSQELFIEEGISNGCIKYHPETGKIHWLTNSGKLEWIKNNPDGKK